MKFVLVHGAAHTGAHFEKVADLLRGAGHQVTCPTLAGNRAGDNPAEITLADAIDSLVDVLADMDDVVLLGHSWGGMAITGAYDKLPAGKIRRLIYYSAFVPNPGESLLDMVPPHYVAMFDEMGAATGTVGFPLPILREAFMNDADLATVEKHMADLVPHPYRTMADKIVLSKSPAEFDCGKSYLHMQQDIALPASYPWHPRLSEKLGLYRLVSMPGSHSTFLTNPELLAEKIIEAGRD
ncbi:alpha/beta fold hydrolase [Pseudosulfitobacter sp. DSM 107133]|uniref:alpha/beta fold hydrolase n=1 Tax=Pseudosulfitobacter sp. DSM 107133 TaxID=2883100 RepID=UPI000DF308E3|nr:alpha/beta fold hydrolase [Pseudosulfitobacter sp. DSM 107133]UOA29239.1 Pyrethroid hydrolase [Pseudosulfitobacter sp. DSM 107133]